MDPITSERESLLDLKQLLDKSQQYQASVLVMGGWAVSAFVGRHRYTKDIDLISAKKARGPLTAAMKELGYRIHDRSFGFKGIRASRDLEVKLDVAVDRILDESRPDQPLLYDPGVELWAGASVLLVSAFHPENQPYQFSAPIVPLTDLLVAKILPVNRANDVLDVASLILSGREQINPVTVARRVTSQDEEFLTKFRGRLLDLAARFREADFRNEWQTELGRRLSDADVTRLRTIVAKVDKGL